MKVVNSVVLTGLLAFAGHAIGGETTDQELAKLQGPWDTIDFKADGDVAPEALLKRIKLTFKNDTLQVSGLMKEPRAYTIKLDPSKKPKVIYITPVAGQFKDQAVQGIYEMEGDRLKLVMPNQMTDSPPAVFESPKGSNLALFISKRPAKEPVKDKEANSKGP